MNNVLNIDLQSNKYYNLSNDYIFKEVFGNKLLLKYLLKTCFNVSLDTFEFRNVELNKNNKYRYSPIVDFKIETDDTIYLVEMQNRNLYNMSERALFSFSRQCQNSLKPNDNFNNIKKIKILIFLNYRFYEDDNYQILGSNYKSYFSDKFEIKVYDILKRNDNLSKLFKIKSKEELDSLKLNKEESIIREYIKRFNMDSKVLLEIERRENIMYLEEIGLYNAREEGRKEGIEQGIEQGNISGKKEATREIILNLLKHNMSLEDISKVTNYSIEEIKQIEKDRK